MVSIFTRAKALSTARPAACVVAAFALSVVTLTAADAEMSGTGGCVGGRGGFNCAFRAGPPGDPYIRPVPQPENDGDKDRAAARDRKWIEHCRPTIAQDRYGVPRYHYAAVGCEFGVIE